LFKGYLRKKYDSRLISGNLPLTPYVKIKRIPASKLAEWIMAVWKKMARKTMKQSYKKCCITDV
jgi:hypothetical protein